MIMKMVMKMKIIMILITVMGMALIYLLIARKIISRRPSKTEGFHPFPIYPIYPPAPRPKPRRGLIAKIRHVLYLLGLHTNT